LSSSFSNTAFADAQQNKYFTTLNKVLDQLQKNYPNSKGFVSARLIYQNKPLQNATVVDIKGLCNLYKIAYQDGNLTKAELSHITAVYWKNVEQPIVDLVMKTTGNNRKILSDFMVVRFAGTLVGVGTYCPTNYNVTRQQFSDSLYARYTTYLKTLA
jgi:hypothetical protein